MGVVCLSDYKSCHKASPKESKKSKFTFVIEKGDVSGFNVIVTSCFLIACCKLMDPTTFELLCVFFSECYLFIIFSHLLFSLLCVLLTGLSVIFY